LSGNDHVVAENQGAHQFRMIGSDAHGQHAAEGMSEEHGGNRYPLAQKAGDVFGILGAVVSARDAGGLSMSAQVDGEDMPAHAERRD